MTAAAERSERSAWSELPRRLLELVLVVVLAGLAYQPLVVSGWVGDDWSTLAAAAELAGLGEEPSPLLERPQELYRVPGTDARPLAAASLAASVRLQSRSGQLEVREAWRFRAENFLLLLLAALGVRRLVHRGLQPWTGAEQAAAAGRAAFLLFIVHPIAVGSVARVGARGELLALALATGACALFLRGRQSGEHGRVLAALVATGLAAASSRHVWFLPLALAGLEYAATRRHRPWRMRLRTSLTTFVVFGAMVVLEELARGAVVGHEAPGPFGPRAAALAAGPGRALTAQAGGAPVDVLGLCAEKLGLLLLPVNTQGIVAVLGYGIAALFLILALHPAFVAARAAPRLWGRILLGWLAVVLMALLPEARTRVVPSGLSEAQVLLSASLLMAAGFGIASTALSGLRRTLLPAFLGLLYAALGHAGSRPWVESAQRIEELRIVLFEQARSHPGAELVVVDLPRTVRGLEAFGPALGTLLDPLFDRAAVLDGAPRPIVVRSIGLDGFFALLRQPETSELRARGVVTILPRRLLALPGDGYQGFRLPAPAGIPARSFWRSDGRSPAGTGFDPLLSRAVRVKARPGTAPESEPLLRWRSRSDRFGDLERRGTWIEGADGTTACFDLGRDLAWLLGEHVPSLWFLPPLTSITSCEVDAEPQVLPVRAGPRAEADDWVFALGAGDGPEGWSRPRALGGPGYWLLGVLDLATWDYLELSALAPSEARLEVPDAASQVRRFLADSPGPLAWSLEWRVAGVTLARASGRLEVEDLAPPER